MKFFRRARILYLSGIFFLGAWVQRESWAETPREKAEKYLLRWRVVEAEKILQPYLNRPLKTPEFVLTVARLRFFQGRYWEALQLLKKHFSPSVLKKLSLYKYIEAAYKLTKNYRKKSSKHFVIYYPPTAEEILVPYALEALEKAYKRVGKFYGYHHTDKVRVEILTNALQLAELSPLTQGDIIRTGTIALCKYNRIMLTSPGALLRGYRWLDTLIHEYSHLLINRIAQGVPIWLHEGLARYSEGLWRSDIPLPLAPYSETLLARALRKNRFIPFKKMHPSMAKLPSEEDASLAYAQVYTVIKYFVFRTGEGSIPKVLRLIQNQVPPPEAFSRILKIPFEQFLKEWKEYLHSLHLKEYKHLRPEKKILKGITPPKEKEKEFSLKKLWFKPKSDKVMGEKYFQLGEMLRRKGRYKASSIEYLKAEKYWKNYFPRLQTKMARTFLRLRQPEKAIRHLKYSLQLYPNHATTYVLLGRAYFSLKKYDEALKAFEEVLQINPFHPLIYKYLIKLYAVKGDESSLKWVKYSIKLIAKEFQ